ncbi:MULTISPECIES: Crp/Fnr family transcriptional regulator [Aquimarina]|uniref:Crp/Fnr family transcriptional regulator n=1 Tax=Aquimarina algiphila TaxID=2047982 RepID=A0A554VBB2_9FLAO|nr:MULTISPECIES: Crp/Fnr family transcriptional regulator [Aquimarina]TSE03766.1 Crp/Fnr family transcriptional regulator [Aquimarina algiphila]
MVNDLTQYVRNYIEISDEEMELFYQYLKVIKLKKKAYVLEEGKVCRARYFIIKGCLRSYYIDEKGVEQIMDFAIDKWWYTNYNSLLDQSPSENFIQALEDTVLLELSLDSFEELTTKLPKIDRLFRIIMERTVIANSNRIKYTRVLSGEEMYQVFLKANPQFFQRVPQYMIASYLGLSPEFISKIKKRPTKKKKM